jgi:hypothetical protein
MEALFKIKEAERERWVQIINEKMPFHNWEISMIALNEAAAACAATAVDGSDQMIIEGLQYSIDTIKKNTSQI